jgi:hypothetical protein
MPRRALPADVAQLAGALTGRLDEVVERLTSTITSDIPSYRAGVVDTDEVRVAVRSNLTFMIEALRRSGAPDLSAPRQTGLLRGQLGAPLPELLRAYRIGFAELWRLLVDEARQSGTVAYDALIDAATEIWELADDYSMAVTDAYREADAGRILASAKERAALVDALLTGVITDNDTRWEIAERLRLPHQGVFVVVAAEATVIGEDPMADAETRLAARDVASAWRLMSGVTAGLLSCGTQARVDIAADVLADVARSRTGMSPPFEHIDDAPDNFRFARTAMSSAPPGSSEVRRFAATPLAVLAASSPDAARQLARNVLGEILALPALDRDTFLATLTAWLRASGSANAAGDAMFVHPNTIRHRLRRVQHYTGRSFDDPNDVADIAAALQAIALFPDLTP